MNRIHWLAALCLFAAVDSACAQGVDAGRVEFEASCAACHGLDGKGDGPVAASLKTKPADLTVLSKKNGGVFPLARVETTIDGRATIASHGSREMPVWGYRFSPRPKIDENYLLAPAISPELIVQARILAVIDYLNRIQSK